MDPKKKLLVFCFWFMFALVFWRGLVFFKNGSISVLRASTGFNFHHYHYGILFMLIGSLILIFYMINSLSIGLVSFGLGTILDGSISRLIGSGIRSREIFLYNQNLLPTLLLFFVVVLIGGCFYVLGGRERF